MKKCPQCGSEMKQIGGETTLTKNCILLHRGDGFRYQDSYGDLTAYHYVCLKCGLIQQYVPDSLLKHLNNLE